MLWKDASVDLVLYSFNKVYKAPLIIFLVKREYDSEMMNIKLHLNGTLSFINYI